MTRLTMTRMALGSLRGQKKRYFSLASGIFLAVFFATALVLASASLGKTMQDDYRARMGEQDVALINIDATEEGSDIIIRRIIKNFIRCTNLHHFTILHNGNSVTNTHSFIEIVGNKDNGALMFRL